MADEELLRVVVERTPERINELEKRGFIIIRRSGQTVNGEQPDFSRHVRGVGLYHHDDTRKRMADWVRGSGVRIVENFYAYRLIRDGAGVHGAVGIDAKGDILPIEAGAVVLASGGPSDNLRLQPFYPGSDGSGLVMALKAERGSSTLSSFRRSPVSVTP
jgi:succinate dehydrogenase/fumarate reductase flavoprotein subunit